MNLEASTQPESISEIGAPEQLIAAREARGWSVSDVAAKLGMMPRQIAAIEQGRWDALPGPAFVRGAIRAYGKALQTDVAPLLATLGTHANVPELRPSSSLDSPLPRHGALGFDNGGSGSRIVWILLGVLGVIAIAMYFGRGADFGQVLEPGGGAQPSRAVDVVPVTPGSSSGSRESAATSGAASTGSGASAGGGAAAAGASNGAAGVASEAASEASGSAAS
ncbi:MAG TPA: helix-turn-helix domain-containing protein, partial [Zeimonas sp.]